MKKIIFTVAIIFATGTITNAKTNNQKTTMFLDCFEMADGLATIYEETHPHASYKRIYQEFATIYDDCHRNTGM